MEGAKCEQTTPKDRTAEAPLTPEDKAIIMLKDPKNSRHNDENAYYLDFFEK